MIKEQIQTKIQNLKREDVILRNKMREIKSQYNRPTQWIADENFKAISRSLVGIGDELEKLHEALCELEDQEWADRQAEHYPDGQV